LRLIRSNFILVVRSPLSTSFATPPLHLSIPFRSTYPSPHARSLIQQIHSSYTDAATAADKLFLPTFDNAQKADSLRATIAFVERSKILFRAPTSLKELTQSVSISSSLFLTQIPWLAPTISAWCGRGCVLTIDKITYRAATTQRFRYTKMRLSRSNLRGCRRGRIR
jgi:hypothetical protein